MFMVYLIQTNIHRRDTTAYPSAPGAGNLGYAKPQVQFASQALSTTVLANMGGIKLTRGVWDVRATATFQTASGTNIDVSVVTAMISTSILHSIMIN